ncbi:ASCH domain-containing protein [Aliihoeflea sp. PC F10.4]
MLFRAAILEKIARGEVTIAFRYWRRPTVKAGGSLRTSVGELAIESVERCEPADISERDARAAGFDEKSQLLAELDQRADSKLYRITFHFGRADPRVALREQDHLKPAEIEKIARTLDRLDGSAQSGPWTQQVMRMIADQSGITAGKIAAVLNVEKNALKRKIRKLKELGLTVSLHRGYRISARGKAVLGALGDGGDRSDATP